MPLPMPAVTERLDGCLPEAAAGLELPWMNANDAIKNNRIRLTFIPFQGVPKFEIRSTVAARMHAHVHSPVFTFFGPKELLLCHGVNRY